MIPLKLSTIKPDFPSLLLQLQMYLQATNTWSDLQTSSTGQTLLEMMAATATFCQFGIESAARETTLTTAVRDSSVYAITRMLGVRIHRKSPASVEGNVTRVNTDTLEAIPNFTQFEVNGVPFFNRQSLMFAQGASRAAERLYYGTPLEVLSGSSFKLEYSLIVALNIKTNDTFKLLVNSGGDLNVTKTVKYEGGNVGENLFTLVDGETPFSDLTTATRVSLMNDVVNLYEGTIIEETFTSDGTPFQQYYLSNKKFTISDIDVEVRIYDETSAAYTTWLPTPDGMWVSGPFDKVYYDSTSGLGEAIIAFGDGINGEAPKLGNTIKIRYAVTSGASANNGLTNLSVSTAALNTVDGYTITVISGGADEKPASYYRAMAPLIFKARNRGVTTSDYKAVSLDYPGIISVSVQSQRDVAPNDLRWMNQVQICLLPAAANINSLTASEWDDFLLYMNKKKHAAVNIIPKDPEPEQCAIDITLSLKTSYIVSAVAPIAESAVRALFNRQSDTLGRRITVSDVTRAAMVDGTDYVVINGCHRVSEADGIRDLVPIDNTHFLELGVFLINTKYSERDIYNN